MYVVAAYSLCQWLRRASIITVAVEDWWRELPLVARLAASAHRSLIHIAVS